MAGETTSIEIESDEWYNFDSSTYVVIGGDEWTFTITSEAITQSAGVTVRQGSNTGTLKTALAGATTSIVIEAVAGLTFNNYIDIVIGTPTFVGVTPDGMPELGGVHITVANAYVIDVENSKVASKVLASNINVTKGWDTSNVTNMTNMFEDASAFNCSN